MTVENILKALGTVQEPDLGKDLVTLNMVRNIVIEGTVVSFTVVLTTPACPLKDLILVCGSVFLAGEVNLKEISF